MKPVLTLVLALAVAIGVVVYIRGRRPSALTQDSDQAVLDQLRANGADLTKPTEVLFYVYTPTREGAEQVADDARADSLRSDVRQAATGDGSWLCLLTGEMVPTLERIKAIGTRLSALAGAAGGEYDGWEAAVTK